MPHGANLRSMIARYASKSLAGCAVLALAACTGVSPWLTARLPPDAVTQGISGTELYRHVKVLASDEFEGRAPGTHG